MHANYLCARMLLLRQEITSFIVHNFPRILTLQRGVTGTARMLHALTHSSISRQVREQM
jgi:hypothetical protein